MGIGCPCKDLRVQRVSSNAGSEAGRDAIDHLVINTREMEVPHRCPTSLQAMGRISHHGMFMKQFYILAEVLTVSSCADKRP